MAKLLKFDPEGNPVIDVCKNDEDLRTKVERIKEGNSFKRVFMVLDEKLVPPIGNPRLNKKDHSDGDTQDDISELMQYL